MGKYSSFQFSERKVFSGKIYKERLKEVRNSEKGEEVKKINGAEERRYQRTWIWYQFKQTKGSSTEEDVFGTEIILFFPYSQ